MHKTVDSISAADLNKSAILGEYEGECADADITNKNGMDIPREVWERVFNSEEFKTGIKLGHYIGFLGHPEDPGCQDFKNACIVMTEGHLAENGKVYGKFNLIDTPVGRIVKTFQDAGVQFGISVRGAGDVIDNVVDAETFCFRGFDLVGFPAYPNSLPKFTAIAASSDVDKQRKYNAVCAAVSKNLDNITSVNALNAIQSQFAAQSPEFAAIEARKCAITCSEDDSSVVASVTEEKLRGMTDLYLSASSRCADLAKECEELRMKAAKAEITAARKVKAVTRIANEQLIVATKLADTATKKNRELVVANRRLKSEVESISDTNLKYNQKMSISAASLAEKERIISELQSKLDETVSEGVESKTRASNLDEKISRLSKQIAAAQSLLIQYQNAYAKLYANAVGANPTNLNITATTSVVEMQRMISGSQNHLAQAITADTALDILSDDDLDDGALVTI